MSRIHNNFTVNQLNVTGTTNSTSSSSGSVVIAGGCSIGGNLYIGGDEVISGTVSAPQSIQNSLFVLPTTNNVTRINPKNGVSARYTGGILATNGNIFCVPGTASNILSINTITNSVTYFGSFDTTVNKLILLQ